MAAFRRYIGIDYSGAEVPDSSLKGLQVFEAIGDGPAAKVLPPPSPRRYWTRRGIATWLAEQLEEGTPTLVGIDHGFSFPIEYFKKHDLSPDWSAFLDDFHAHWPTDEAHTYVDFVREGLDGKGSLRSGDSRWRRLVERRTGAKSVFHFDVPGSVAKSTHAGLPWIRFLRQRPGVRIHCWPFDGWEIPAGKSVLAEVYPSLWSHAWPREGRTSDEHDAFSVASWLRQADHDGSLADFLHPSLSPAETDIARIEGWILGVR